MKLRCETGIGFDIWPDDLIEAGFADGEFREGGHVVPHFVAEVFVAHAF
jgi:hypothetical protein